MMLTLLANQFERFLEFELDHGGIGIHIGDRQVNNEDAGLINSAPVKNACLFAPLR